jgi:spore coat polysaccharide biosynthesis protein SpsF
VHRVAIIQARMGSTRLPGKVLAAIGPGTVLSYVVARLRRAKTLDRVVVATTTAPRDQALVEHASTLGVDVMRGDEQNVLARYRDAAAAAGADVIVRITADCPLVDAEIVDRVVTAFVDAAPVDFAANTLRRTYPAGLDVEVIGRQALERAWREARKQYQRVHVCPYIYEHPEEFKLLSVVGDHDYSWMRWAVDTAEDLAFVRAVYDRLGYDVTISWRDVIALLARAPELLEINRHVRQKQLREG